MSLLRYLDPSNPFGWIEHACRVCGEPKLAAEMKKHGDLVEAGQAIAMCKATGVGIPEVLKKTFEQRYKKAFGTNHGKVIVFILDNL